jgi:hypothetical protein
MKQLRESEHSTNEPIKRVYELLLHEVRDRDETTSHRLPNPHKQRDPRP